MVGMEPLIFESCHSTWLFDTDRMRFRRILKGIASGPGQVSTEWRPYFGLEIDRRGEYFAILLNADGSRLLRSWRHTSECTECGLHTTGEHSLDELRSDIGENADRSEAEASAAASGFVSNTRSG